MNYITTRPLKSYGISILLVLIFGPFGLFYASVWGGIIMGFIVPFSFLLTFYYSILSANMFLFISSIILWLIAYYIVCLIWAITGVSYSNKKIAKEGLLLENDLSITKHHASSINVDTQLQTLRNLRDSAVITNLAYENEVTNLREKEKADEDYRRQYEMQFGKKSNRKNRIYIILIVSLLILAVGFFLLKRNKEIPPTYDQNISLTDEGNKKEENRRDTNFHVEHLQKIHTVKQLCKEYGSKNIKVYEVGGLEDDFRSGKEYRIFPNTKNEVAINFKQHYVRLTKNNSEWQVKNNLYVGEDLENVVVANANDFIIYGFEWDYGGQVYSWDNGKIDSSIIVTFAPSKEVTYDLHKQITGDRKYKTSDPILKMFKPKIKEIVLFTINHE